MSSAILDEQMLPRFGVTDWFVEDLVSQGDHVIDEMTATHPGHWISTARCTWFLLMGAIQESILPRWAGSTWIPNYVGQRVWNTCYHNSKRGTSQRLSFWRVVVVCTI